MFIAVDIGGTQLRAALYPEHGIEPIDKQIIVTHAGDEKPEDRLIDLIGSVWPKHGGVQRIGVAVAGPVNPKTGVVYNAPNISGWIDLPLGGLIEKHHKTTAILGNDANLAALGEWKYGAGVGHHDLIYLTISTGIGGGIIIDDRLLVGPQGIAAEVGHITVLPDGPMCGCGHRGHLEAVSSGTAIANYVETQLSQGRASILSLNSQKPTGRLIAEAAAKGDLLALEAFEYAGAFLGRAIADLLHIFNPTVIVLGGGVTNAKDILMNPVRRAIDESVMTPEYKENLEICFAKLGDQAGLVGALALARS
ncbi:MAG: glucokinase [Chloroflexi bacterium]|nr:MAG: glucokinase [Chloroflexota bacterium]MBA4376714.1 transcriptional regulator [Anaerolinea sp.]